MQGITREELKWKWKGVRGQFMREMGQEKKKSQGRDEVRFMSHNGNVTACMHALARIRATCLSILARTFSHPRTHGGDISATM